MKQEEPILVAIQSLVYNHEPYLRDCFEGFVMQKTNFRFVAIVHEDCSTDHSADIIREYEAKYPEIFRPIYETENQWSKSDGSLGRIMNAAIDDTGAKYIAICEGDDYWTDSYKLQKQVDFMEAHPECTVTFHRYDILRQEEQTWRKDACDVYLRPDQSEVLLNVPMFFKRWVTQPCTMMYRYGTYLGQDKPYKEYKDQHIIFHLLTEGEGYILNFKGAVYREHQRGIHGRTPVIQQSRLAVNVAQELYDNNKEESSTKDNLVETLDWAINCEKRYKEGDKRRLRLFIWRRLLMSKSIKIALKQLLRK